MGCYSLKKKQFADKNKKRLGKHFTENMMLQRAPCFKIKI